MKHRVTVEVEAKHHFLGIPYTNTKKKRIEVDGKTYRQMKREERDREEAELAEQAEALACMGVLLEEEYVDLFGEE